VRPAVTCSKTESLSGRPTHPTQPCCGSWSSRPRARERCAVGLNGTRFGDAVFVPRRTQAGQEVLTRVGRPERMPTQRALRNCALSCSPAGRVGSGRNRKGSVGMELAGSTIMRFDRSLQLVMGSVAAVDVSCRHFMSNAKGIKTGELAPSRLRKRPEYGSSGSNIAFTEQRYRFRKCCVRDATREATTSNDDDLGKFARSLYRRTCPVPCR
jgi:hypothetical protein